MKQPVVLDKSYLQGSTRAHVHKLAHTHRLLMSEALLYELLSNQLDRKACFAKLPPTDNPVDLVTHVGGYLLKEINTRRPSPKPSERTHRLRFQFNPLLLTDTYELPQDATKEIARQQAILLNDTGELKQRALGMPSFFPEVFQGGKTAQRSALDEAERLIAFPGSLLEFYGQLRTPKGFKRFPPTRLVTDTWAVYRWFQVQFLFSLDLYARYGETLAAPLSQKVEEKIEHDVLDAQYMFIGVLEGAFATEERKLQRWFRLLCPDGVLLVSVH